MTDPHIDPQRLAALLDGRLDEHEREALLAELGDSDEEFSIFADALFLGRAAEAEGTARAHEGADVPATPAYRGEPATVAAESAAEPAAHGPSNIGVSRVEPARSADVIDIRSRRGKPGRAGWIVAAALAAAAVLAVLWPHGGEAGPGAFVALLGADARIPEESAWGAVRGGEDVLPASQRAVRLGARLVDLRIAARSRDSAAVDTLAPQAAALVLPVPGGGAVSDQLRALPAAARSGDGGVAALAKPEANALKLVDRGYAALGAWAEAARVAARAHDAAYFADRASREELGRAAKLPSLPGEAAAVLNEVRARMAAPTTDADWTALSHGIDALLTAAGG